MALVAVDGRAVGSVCDAAAAIGERTALRLHFRPGLSMQQQRGLPLLAGGNLHPPRDEVVVSLTRNDTTSTTQRMCHHKGMASWNPWGLVLETATMQLQRTAMGSPASASPDIRGCTGMVLRKVRGTEVCTPADAEANVEEFPTITLHFSDKNMEQRQRGTPLLAEEGEQDDASDVIVILKRESTAWWVDWGIVLDGSTMSLLEVEKASLASSSAAIRGCLVLYEKEQQLHQSGPSSFRHDSNGFKEQSSSSRHDSSFRENSSSFSCSIQENEVGMAFVSHPVNTRRASAIAATATDVTPTHDIDGVDMWPAITGANTTNPRPWLPTTETSILNALGNGSILKLYTSAPKTNRWLANGTQLADDTPWDA
eukprot:gene10125-biopygen114421